MSLQEFYCAVKEQIKKVDFPSLWEGFRPLRFAFYDQDSCCFDGVMIEKTPDFLGNTAINYRGETIAIWNVMEEIDPTVLASKLIHEMFHGFQALHHESRFPNELRALYSYRYNEENLSAKLQENQLLAQLTQSFCAAKFSKLLSLRKYRALHFPNEFLYEAKIEQIEGSANYVELNALKQLSPALYRQKLSQMCEHIQNPSNLLPIRIISYDIGALLLHVIKENNIPLSEDFSDLTFSEVLIENVPALAASIDCSIGKAVEEFDSSAKQTIHLALQNNDILIEKETALLGVNVYNAVYYDKYIISKHFVMYGDASAPTVSYGDFVIETPHEGIATKIFKI